MSTAMEETGNMEKATGFSMLIFRICSLFLSFFCFFLCFGKEIALTFDDIPMHGSALYKRQERIDILLEKLREEHIQAAFFCIGQYYNESSVPECLKKIAAENHFLANHSYRHHSLSTQTIDQFIEELDKTEEALASFPTRRKWYRFPYLDFGNREEKGGSQEKKEEAFKVLENKGFIHGYITINTFDWLVDNRMQSALKNNQPVHFDRLKKVYLDLLEEWISKYDFMWEEIEKNNIVHVLLLHGNDLNALCLNELAALLRSKGWKIVSPQKAYEDPSLHFTTLGDLYFQYFGVPYITPSSLSASYIDAELSKAKVFEE